LPPAGTYQPQVAIERIVIEHGAACGIALADGRTVRARSFVASTIDAHQTFETLVGRAQLSAAFCGQTRSLPIHRLDVVRPASCLARGAAIFRRGVDPNIKSELKWSIGAETIADCLGGHRGREATACRASYSLAPARSASSDPTPGAARQAQHLLLGNVCRSSPISGGQKYEDFKREFCQRSSRPSPRYWPEHGPDTTYPGQ